MKKLLSLLSVLTISGTAVPTMVANKPYVITAYENTEQIKDNNLKNKKPTINSVDNDINYTFIYSYVKKDSDYREITQIKWKSDSISNWNDFINKYPIIKISGTLIAGIESHGSHTVTSPIMLSKDLKNGSSNAFQISSDYFETAGRYTSILLYIWHDDENIHLTWGGFFKGDVTNSVAISLLNMTFGWLPN